MKKIFFAIFIFAFLVACSEGENAHIADKSEMQSAESETPAENLPVEPEVSPENLPVEQEAPPEDLPVEPEAPPEPDFRHPFAIALAEFFTDLASVPTEAEFPFNTHAILVDMDGNGTPGMIAAKRTAEPERYPYTWERGGFVQKLFYIYDGELHYMYRGCHGLTVTPGGRLVFIDNAGMSNLNMNAYTLVGFADGKLAPVVSVSISEWWFSYYEDYGLGKFIVDRITVDLVYPTGEFIQREGFNSWDRGNSFEYFRTLEGDEIYEKMTRYDLLELTRATRILPEDLSHTNHFVRYLPCQASEILAMTID